MCGVIKYNNSFICGRFILRMKGRKATIVSAQMGNSTSFLTQLPLIILKKAAILALHSSVKD